MEALYAFGAPADIPREFFFERGNVFRMGRTPMKIEVLTSASGVDFARCYDRRKTVQIDDLTIPFIGFDDLIANKKASARAKDIADLESLGQNDG